MRKKAIVNTSLTRQERVRRRLLEAARKDPSTLQIQYDNTEGGYDADQIEESLDQYGKNVITTQKKISVWRRLFDAFINPFTVVLFILSGFSLVVDQDPVAFTIVMTMVLVSGLLRFVQESRSAGSAEKLTEMVETTAAVFRTDDDDVSDKIEIPLDEIVVGDIVVLAAGDIIPADIRILSAKDLFINQASLTGESEPVEKFAAPAPLARRTQKNENHLEQNNLAFMGSTVVSGSATAIVIAVGDDTELGQISAQLGGRTPPTSFEKGVSAVSWVLIRFMLIMVPIVFFVNGFTKHDWAEALLFGLSVAVGLTPEMLPMIVSANLAKGAVGMSKKQVVVKELNAIQNFGAMDILCTDKTGTLTQDKIILEYHYDVHGNPAPRVLRHAYLNSFYQTGLKNLMDISIIERAEEDDVAPKNYEKIDEIPFDFARRRMSVVVRDDKGKTQLITKGAIEEMLAVSSYVDYGDRVEPITNQIRAEVMEKCNGYNDDGLRVLGVAQKTNPSPEGTFSVADESEMVLIGYLAFLDPPKESAADAIEALNDYGVTVKILTGDNDAVTRCVSRQVGLNADQIVLGAEVEAMDDDKLKTTVETCDIFAKLSPNQKARIVAALRENGHTVGYMGDGINDAAAMKASDVGISVDTAVDIAKESAKIILLEKDLMVLESGVVEGRKIYANIIKYIKMTASSNFGNMFSVLAACAFLPFLPMLPIHLLLLNLIYDISCISLPWDNVDKEFLARPRKWDASSISKFMVWIGPTSSLFDIATYLLMYFVVCPAVVGAPFDRNWAADSTEFQTFAGLFWAGWFVESMWSQTLVIHMIRTPKIPFLQSRASAPVTLLTAAGIAVLTVIPFTSFGAKIGFHALPPVYFAWLGAIIVGYMLIVTLFKKIFVKKYGELL